MAAGSAALVVAGSGALAAPTQGLTVPVTAGVAIAAGALSLLTAMAGEARVIRGRCVRGVVFTAATAGALALAVWLVQVGSDASPALVMIAAIWALGTALGLLGATAVQPQPAGRVNAIRLMPVAAVAILVGNVLAAGFAAGPIPHLVEDLATESERAPRAAMASPGPVSPIWSAEALSELEAIVPVQLVDSCSPAVGDALVGTAQGSSAMLACHDGDTSVSYWLEPDAWTAHLDFGGLAAGAEGAGAWERDASGCWTGSSGQAAYGDGLLACWVSDGRTLIAWTDDRAPVVALASAPGEDVSATMAWWWGVGSLVPPVERDAAAIASLLDLVAPWLRTACAPLVTDGSRDGRAEVPIGATAAIECALPSSVVASQKRFRLPNEAALARAFDLAASLSSASVTPSSCPGGAADVVAGGRLIVACGRSAPDGMAVIRWADRSTLTLGMLTGATGSVADTYSWWIGNGMP